MFAGELASHMIRETKYLHVTKLSSWFEQVQIIQNSISKSKLQGLVCFAYFHYFKNKDSIHSNEFIAH